MNQEEKRAALNPILTKLQAIRSNVDKIVVTLGTQSLIKQSHPSGVDRLFDEVQIEIEQVRKEYDKIKHPH